MSARNPAAQGRLYGGLPRPNVLEPPFGRGLPRVPHHALHEEMREAYHSLPGPMQLPAQLEQHLEAQQSLIEALRVDKERLIADNVTLKRELEDTRKQHAEMDLQMSRLYNKFDRMENELRAMRSELSNVHKCIKDSTATNAEIEGLKAELKQIRVAIEHEKKGSAECFQHDKAMEDKVITIAREMENLQAELINAKNKAQAAVVVGNSGCFKVATGLVENLTDVEPSINKKKRRRKKSKKKPKIKDEILNIDQIEMETWSTENLAEGDVNGKRERTSCDVKMTSHLSCLDVKDAERLSKDASSKRKLLVLDVNGLLGNVVKPQKSHRVVKRPFVDDFLGFCFQNFDVGVWSSRKRINLFVKNQDIILLQTLRSPFSSRS